MAIATTIRKFRPAALTSVLWLGATVLLTGCDQNTPTQDASPAVTQQAAALPESTDSSAFRSFLGLSAYTSLSMATQKAQQLDQQLSGFLHQPDTTSLVQLQSAWREAYNAYLQSLIFAYLPIKDPVEWRKQGIDYHDTLALLDSWPVEGGYIDHVPGYPFSGIVNDLTLELNETSLLAQHGFSDPSYASLGYHALEFMFWGANGDRNSSDFFAQENTAPVVMPSEGSATDSETQPDSSDGTATKSHPAINAAVQNHNRRRQYVSLVNEQLQKHLQRLQRRWQPSNGYYANLLDKTEPRQALTATFVAAQKLLSEELIDRRLSADSSEFSNTGIDDIAALVQGLQAILLPADENQGQGLTSLLIRDDQQTLLAEWHSAFGQLYTTLEQWQEQSRAGSGQNTRQQLITLLSLLQKTADELGVRLARSE